MMSEQESFSGYTEIHIIENLLPFFQLFSQYKIGFLSIGTILLIVGVVLLIIRKSGYVPYSACFKPYLAFLIYIIVRDLLRAIIGPDLMQTQINRMIEYLVLFLLASVICSQTFDEDCLYKTWKIAGTIFTVGIIFHVIQIYFLGQSISPISIIPGFTLRPEESIAQLRPSSFFAEPASFVIAMLPLEFLSLKRKDFRWAIFSTVSILLSASTVGIILSVILWTAVLIGKDSSFKSRIITIIIATGIVGLFMNLDIFSLSLSKLFEVASGESTFGSRVLTGFEVIRRQSIESLIFGTNYNDVSSFVTDNINDFTESLVVMTYWINQRLFLNTFCRLIFQYGIIGLMLFISPFVKYLKQSGYEAKPLVIMALVAIFGQTMLLNPYYFTLIIIFMLYDNKQYTIYEE